MIEIILENIYQIKLPLPNNPLRELNSYLITGRDKSLLIDTGFNREETSEALMKALEELNIDLNRLDILVSHLHADHSGGIGLFKDTSPNFFASKKDGDIANRMATISHWESLEKFIPLFGMADEISYRDNPGYKYSTRTQVDFINLKEGDLLSYGGYNFIVIDMPGHTRGMINLYEPNHKIYFSADHILDRITPNISFWGFEEDDLANYLNSLGKVRNLEIDLILPAHRNTMTDHPRRVDELIEHHMNRLEEILKIFENTEDEFTVKEIASKMDWEINEEGWEKFPPPQKWFAGNEAMSHLMYLHNKGHIDAIFKKDTIYFSK